MGSSTDTNTLPDSTQLHTKISDSDENLSAVEGLYSRIAAAGHHLMQRVTPDWQRDFAVRLARSLAKKPATAKQPAAEVK